VPHWLTDSKENLMNRLWRTAGALCIAHVALLFGGYAQMRSAGFGASPTDIVSSYQQAVPTRMYAGGLLAILAMLVLLATLTLFGRLLRGTTETSRWFASLVTTAGAVAITVTLAGAYACAGAAYFAATHGYNPDVVASLHEASKYADFITMIGFGVLALAVGAAVLTSGALARWFGFISLAVGAVGIASGNAAVLDKGTLVWVAWLIALGVVSLRTPRRVARAAIRTGGATPILAEAA
jgi:hypothetical protein